MNFLFMRRRSQYAPGNIEWWRSQRTLLLPGKRVKSVHRLLSDTNYLSFIFRPTKNSSSKEKDWVWRKKGGGIKNQFSGVRRFRKMGSTRISRGNILGESSVVDRAKQESCN